MYLSIPVSFIVNNNTQKCYHFYVTYFLLLILSFNLTLSFIFLILNNNILVVSIFNDNLLIFNHIYNWSIQIAFYSQALK